MALSLSRLRLLGNSFILNRNHNLLFTCFYYNFRKYSQDDRRKLKMPPISITASKEGIKEVINKNDFVMFSLSHCPFCAKAKEFFRSKSVDPMIIEVDQSPESAAIRAHLYGLTGQRTFPSIFVHSNHLGGCDDVLSLEKEGLYKSLVMVYKERKNLENSNQTFDYDAVVVGGGSGGLAFAKEMSQFGKKVALFDFVTPSPMGTKWGLGGTCVNVGCIPKKLMHQAAILHDNIRKSKYYGFTTGDAYHDWQTMLQNINNYIRSLNFAYKVELRSKEVTYINSLAKISGKHEISYTESGENKKLTSKYIILATGERPDYPDIPGKNHCISSDDLFWLKYPPGKTLIIGASYVALECAGALHGMGFDVTVMVRSIFLRGYDQEMATKIGKFMENKGIKIIRPAIPLEVEMLQPIDHANLKPGLLRVKYKYTEPESSAGHVLTDEFNTVMVAIGRASCNSGIGLEELGLSFDPRKRIISADNREQTSCPNIFAIGDLLSGKPQLTPVAIKAGQLLARRLCNDSFENCDYSTVPTTIFTPIEYGAIGYSEEDAKDKFGEDDIDVYHNFCEPLEEKVVENVDHEAFYAKLVCRTSQMNRVIGLHILSPNAGEIAQGYAVALKMGATLKDFNRTFGIHPTVSEVFTNMRISKKSDKKMVAAGC